MGKPNASACKTQEDSALNLFHDAISSNQQEVEKQEANVNDSVTNKSKNHDDTTLNNKANTSASDCDGDDDSANDPPNTTDATGDTFEDDDDSSGTESEPEEDEAKIHVASVKSTQGTNTTNRASKSKLAKGTKSDSNHATDNTTESSETDATASNPNKPQPEPIRSNKRSYQIPVDDGSLLTVVDVVLGRGGMANNHPGNKDLLQRIKDLQLVYKKYQDMNKQEKNESTRLISDWVQERGGRFLKLDTDKDLWREVDQRQAFNKIMHMFRDDHSTEGRARKRLKYSKYKPNPTGTVATHSSVAGPNNLSRFNATLDMMKQGLLPSSNVQADSSTNGTVALFDVVAYVNDANESQAPSDPSQISDKDILFGRGGHANNNLGNQRLLDHIKSLQDEYKAFGNSEIGKKNKKDLTLKVVAWVHENGGRFLKRDKRDGPWEETTINDARLKVSQLFRNDHTPEARLRKRKKYNGEIWSKRPAEESSKGDDSSSRQDAEWDKGSNLEEEEEPSEDDQRKPPAVPKPAAATRKDPPGTKPSATSPAKEATKAFHPVEEATTSSAASSLAKLAQATGWSSTKKAPPENHTAKGIVKKASGKPSNQEDGTSEKDPKSSDAAVVKSTAPTLPPAIDPTNPITNVTLPEGGAYPPPYHLPPYPQYYSMGMHHHPMMSSHQPHPPHYIPPPMMNYPFDNHHQMVARMPPGGGNGSVGPSNETNPPNLVTNFTDKDILLGRGGHANHHPGNKLLLDRVKELQPTYKSFGSEEDGKKQKNNLTRELVEWVRSKGGRFLKRSSKDVPWTEVSYNEARMKVSHLFRNDHTPEGRERKRKRYAMPKNAGEPPE